MKMAIVSGRSEYGDVYLIRVIGKTNTSGFARGELQNNKFTMKNGRLYDLF